MTRSVPAGLSLPVLLGGLLVVSGCHVGTTTRVVAPGVEHRVSLTGAIHDDQGTVRTPGSYERVGSFSFQAHRMGWEWPVRIERDWDISRALNAEVERWDGDGVANLEISLSDSALNTFTLTVRTASIFTAVIGFILLVEGGDDRARGAAFLGGSAAAHVLTPGFARIRIQGDVVRFP